MEFTDRIQAGRMLAERLTEFSGPDVVVLGLPRGGVPVAAQVARHLRAPLDVILVRKLGVPSQPELAMGAIGEGGVITLNAEVISLTHAHPDDISRVEAKERAELERRADLLRGRHERLDLTGRTALIIDDGLATGSTAIAACQVARAHGAERVVVAVPVAPADAAARMRPHADEFIALKTPAQFLAVGYHYENFDAVSDAQVIEILGRYEPDAPTPEHVRSRISAHATWSEDVTIPVGMTRLLGHLEIPADPIGIVLFAHGSGSSRLSPRNIHVAEVLHRAGIGTLLFDLLTVEEERDRSNVFDIELLAERLRAVTDWIRTMPEVTRLPVGYFGASTGAGAALLAASFPSSDIAAVVSRGGRPDLAGIGLGAVKAPTLLIVGGDDHVVIELNRDAASRLRCESKISIIPGATHLFEEHGTLDEAASQAADWFTDHMAGAHMPGDRTRTTPTRRKS